MQVEAAGTVFMWEVIIRICLWILESVKKRIEEGLKTLDLKGDDLNGILITHEHSDHIQGLGVFSRKYQVPIYATKGTLEGIKSYSGLGKMPEGLYHPIHTDEPFTLGDMDIHPF